MKISPAILIGLVGLLTPITACLADERLTGTELLKVDQPLDKLMLDGLHRFCQRELAASREQRAKRWTHDNMDLAPHRERLRSMIGAVDSRVTANAKEPRAFEFVTTLDRLSVLARSGEVTIHAIHWPVLDGVNAEGVLLVPKTLQAGIVALPDADWTPEMLCGLTDELPESLRFVRRLAESGCLVAIPTLISRSDEFSGHPRVGFTNQSHREVIYRQAFEVGRHVIGYEVQKVLAAVDLIEQRFSRRTDESSDRSPTTSATASLNAPVPIGVAGVGEGGLVALHSAALDSRIQCCWVSGYFGARENVWQEPIDRNIWGLLAEFGDAELASLIAPRRLVIEACRTVEVAGPLPVRDGRRPSAAPGRILTNPLPSVRAEYDRAASTYRRLGREASLVLAVSGENGDGSAGTDDALRAFAEGLGISLKRTPETHAPDEAVMPKNSSTSGLSLNNARQKRQFDELQAHVQKLIQKSHHVRDAKWQQTWASVEDWERARPGLRDWVNDELIGRLPHRKLPHNARTRRVLETDHYVGYEVVLDVFEDVIASGILLLPKDIAASEKRPVVVCQHGLEGTPMDTITREPKPFAYYQAFSEELVQRGFIVYAPQNPYRGGERFRQLQRMLNPLKWSLFSVIIAQHEQTLDWLATLPNVDSKEIAFYGLSYGGKTAMRVPPLVDRYCLSICSGDFTDWPRTVASNDERFTYLFTSEYENPEWNLAHVANYAELAMLMSPRPFMVEAGYRDGGQPTELVAAEFSKVRRHYDQLRIGNLAKLEFFDGPHTIHGQETFRFLKRELDWPRRQKR
jgi:cephalosporin-C deacetylase-like acetyl esterase